MAANPQLPRPQSQLSDAADQPTREWYEFWRQLLEFARENGATQTQIAELEQRVAALEQVENFTITGLLSVRVFGSPQSGTVVLQLLNDAQAPGNTYYYGTGPTGTKGWFAIADAFTPGDGIALTTGPDGVTEIAHGDTSTVTDITANFLGSTVVGQISLTFDQFGHVVSRTITGRQLDHNDLNAIQGGASGEYYHLTSAEYTKVQALPAASQPLDDDLTAIAALATTGFPVRTATNTWAQRSFANGTGYTWTNPGGVAGDPTLVLSANLQAWSGLATSAKENAITAGTTAQFWRGDKAWSNNLTDSLGLGPVTTHNLGFTPMLRMEGMSTPLPCAAMVRYVGTLNGPFFYGAKARGTTSMPAGVQSGDQLFQIRAVGANSSGTFGAAGGSGILTFYASESFTTTATGTYLRFATTGTGTTATAERWEIAHDGHLLPVTDNTYNVGSASLRVKEYFGAIGAINTSDAREKTEVDPFTDAELAAAAELARSIGTYQWLASIIAKGADARTHTGLTVQRAIEIMQAHGLDPFGYGFICYDQWGELPEISDPETGEVSQPYRPAGDRYSFRHDQLLLFIARGQEERIARLEALLNS